MELRIVWLMVLWKNKSAVAVPVLRSVNGHNGLNAQKHVVMDLCEFLTC